MDIKSEPRQNAERGPRFALAIGSGMLTVLGLAFVARDVITEDETGAGWMVLLPGVIGLVAAGIWRGVADATDVTTDRPPADRVEGAGKLRWITIGAVVFLLAQAVIPLRYYFGSDPYDERFAWRMFSDIRMQQCRVSATETAGGSEHVVPLMRTIHVAWITTLERNRSAVVRRYLRWRCEQEGVTSARLTTNCVTPDGRPVPPLVRTIDCASGEIEGALE